jgi:transposase
MEKDKDLKSRVYQFYAENIEKGKHYVAKHFLDEKVPKTTVYRHIRSAEQNKPLERKVGSGRKPQIASKANIRKIKNWMDHKDGISGRAVARRLNCSHVWVQKILNKYTHIRFYKKK